MQTYTFIHNIAYAVNEIHINSVEILLNFSIYIKILWAILIWKTRMLNIWSCVTENVVIWDYSVYIYTLTLNVEITISSPDALAKTTLLRIGSY